MVGAALDCGVELTAGGVTEVWRELVGDGSELTDCVIGDVNQWAGDALVVVVDTFNGEVICFGAKTADRGAGADAETAAGGDARYEERQVENTVGRRGGGRFLSSSDSNEDSSWVVVVSIAAPASAETWTVWAVVATGNSKCAVEVAFR